MGYEPVTYRQRLCIRVTERLQLRKIQSVEITGRIGRVNKIKETVIIDVQRADFSHDRRFCLELAQPFPGSRIYHEKPIALGATAKRQNRLVLVETGIPAAAKDQNWVVKAIRFLAYVGFHSARYRCRPGLAYRRKRATLSIQRGTG